MGRVTTIMIAGLALGIQTAAAQNWVAGALPERSYDFGTVAPPGSKLLHGFRVINRTTEEIHIADWRTKCGCTEVRVGSRVIPPGTQTVVEAVLDTTKFQGHKASGLTLVLDRPSAIELDLNLSCFIQSEVVLNPGQVDFGIVHHGSQPTVAITIHYNGGRPDFAVARMQTRTGDVTAKVQRSSEGNSQLILSAVLSPTLETGVFRDQITLFTNDPAAPTIPISVTANVQSDVTVSPSVLNLGRVHPGEVIKRTVLVRSTRPFKLLELKASKDDLSATPDPDGARPLHSVNLTFKAPAHSGPYHAVCEIATDLKDATTAKLATFATITP